MMEGKRTIVMKFETQERRLVMEIEADGVFLAGVIEGMTPYVEMMSVGMGAPIMTATLDGSRQISASDPRVVIGCIASILNGSQLAPEVN